MRAMWLFATNKNDGSGINEPNLPDGHGGSFVVPGDIYKLSGGPSGLEHDHLLVGGYALPDEAFATEPNHTHLAINVNGTFVQVTRGTTPHTHDINMDDSGNIMQDYFLLFWSGEDAGATLIENSAQCFPIVDAIIDEDGAAGDLEDTVWDATELAFWSTAVLNILGFQLPPEVDRGSRLVLLFLGMLLSRSGGERSLR